MQKDFYLSKNFTFFELTKTGFADLQEQNRADAVIYKDNLVLLCLKILQPIRDYWQRPVIINSGFRCPALNEQIGGSKTSQHLFGQAADFIVKDIGCGFIFDNFLTALSSVNFGQFIFEKKGDKEWLHISLPTKTRKNEMLVFENGTYRKI